MKKFLLSLLTAASIGFAAHAESVTVTYSTLGYANAADVTTVATGDPNISIVCDKGTSNNPHKYYNTGSGLRMYSGNTMTISANGNYEITNIEFTASESNYVVKGSANVGTYTTSGAASTWTGNAAEIVLTTSATCRLQKMTVTYEAVGGAVKTPVTLTWEPSEQTLKLGEAFVAPALKVEPAEAASAVTLAAEGLISIENGNLVLEEGKAGVASVTASIESEEYYATPAVYNLTVVDPNAIKDEITSNDFTKSTASSYYTQTYTSSISGVTYQARMINDGGTNIQMNNTEGFYISANPSDLVISKITVTFAGKTNSARTVSVYASEEVTEAPLSITNKITEFTKSAGDEQSFVPTEDYKGLCMKVNAATYLTSIVIEYREADGTPKLNPNLRFDVESYDLTEGLAFDGVTLLSDYEVSPIVYSSSNPEVATIIDEATGYIKALTPGTTVITATFEGNDEYRKSSASYKLNVIAEPYHYFKDVIAKTSKNDKVIMTGAFTVIYQSGANTILTDGKSNMLCYGYDIPAYEVGTAISRIEATVDVYSNLFELKSVTLTEGGEGAEISPVELTSFEGINYDENLFDLVEVKGATISGVNGIRGTLNLNGETVAMYNNFGIGGYANTEDGMTVAVKGFVWRNYDDLQISPISIDEEESDKVDAQLAWSVEEFAAIENTEYTEGLPVLTNELGVEVVYTSSDEDVAMYEDGMLMAFNAGTAVITATPADTDRYFGSATFTVTVAAKPHLGAITVNGQAVADSEVIDVVVNTEVVIAAENAEMVEYEIAGPEGFEASDLIEGSSYSFTPAVIGEYIVTFTAEGCDEEAEVTFAINVTEVPAITEEILDFVNNDYGMERGNNSKYNDDGFVLEGTEFTYTTIKDAGTNGTRLWSDGLRFYKGGSLTATAPLGYMIESIETLNESGNAASISNLATSISVNEVTATVKYTATSKNAVLPGLRVVIKPAEAPEVEGYSPELVDGENVVTSTDEATGAVTIIITHDDKHASVYYKHTPATAPAAARRVVSHEGYELAASELDEDGTHSVHTFTVPSAGKVEYYAYHAATDTQGEVRSFSVSATGEVTSISEITFDGEATDAIYDLQGRRVAKPTRGLFIQNGVKVMIRK